MTTTATTPTTPTTPTETVNSGRDDDTAAGSPGCRRIRRRSVGH